MNNTARKVTESPSALAAAMAAVTDVESAATANEQSADRNAVVEANKRKVLDRHTAELADIKREGLTFITRREALKLDLNRAMDAAIIEYNTEVAGQILRWNTENPVGNSAKISRGFAWLEKAVRTGLDTMANAKQHPVLVQALKLAPPRDDMNMPMYLLGGITNGVTDWPARRVELFREMRSSSLLEAA